MGDGEQISSSQGAQPKVFYLQADSAHVSDLQWGEEALCVTLFQSPQGSPPCPHSTQLLPVEGVEGQL